MELLFWLIAAVLVALGLAGTVLPVLPGTPLVFSGLVLAAWIEHFQKIGVVTIAFLGALTAIAWLCDFIAASLGARRAGASPLAVGGALVGMAAGLPAGLPGFLFGPLAGAFVGELVARRNLMRAGVVSLSTWVGLLVAVAFKLGIALAMLGVFIAAYFI
ncbi:MAG: DUF456 family protein [Betaproteobacteria bacterium]|nr:DUF456 family protein [Betaproteobacteria bacterium]